jgi:hypothetical protein
MIVDLQNTRLGRPGVNVIKLFTDVIYSSLVGCFWVRPGANLSVEHLKNASLEKALALLINIRLDWRGLPWTNPLANCKHL